MRSCCFVLYRNILYWKKCVRFWIFPVCNFSSDTVTVVSSGTHIFAGMAPQHGATHFALTGVRPISAVGKQKQSLKTKHTTCDEFVHNVVKDKPSMNKVKMSSCACFRVGEKSTSSIRLVTAFLPILTKTRMLRIKSVWSMQMFAVHKCLQVPTYVTQGRSHIGFQWKFPCWLSQQANV